MGVACENRVHSCQNLSAKQSKAEETHGAAGWIWVGGMAQLIQACLEGSEIQGHPPSTY